jgi:glycoside/pentoside/hexuronide:cation symporter, GPH family
MLGAILTQAPAPTVQLKGSTKLFYGFGTVAFGVKDAGFNSLLMLFYNQALGLPAHLVGLAIMIALVLDGFIDPVIGHMSDRLQSKFGRRHPFMYGAAIPCAIFYYALWNPPSGLDHGALFGYLLVTAIIVRIAIAFYEIPSASLMAELTDNYNERTNIVGLRYFFGWAGGIVMGVLAFGVFLASPSATSDVTNPAVLNITGYHHYAIAAAIIMASAILISAVGTHSTIAHLRAPPPPSRLSWRQTLAEMWDALKNRPLILTLLTGLFGNLAAGVNTSLSIYFGTYFWGLTSEQFSALILTTFFSAGGAAILSSALTRTVEKKRGALIVACVGLVLMPLPMVLRLLDLMPENGSPVLLPILAFHYFLTTMLSVTTSILVTSMLADTVEVNELKTKTRTEGLYFAAAFFIQKCTSGLGIFFAGVIIALVQFPVGAQVSEVNPATLTTLALVFLPVVLICHATAIFFISRYDLKRADHEGNLARIREGGNSKL